MYQKLRFFNGNKNMFFSLAREKIFTLHEDHCSNFRTQQISRRRERNAIESIFFPPIDGEAKTLFRLKRKKIGCAVMYSPLNLFFVPFRVFFS